jgi:Ala-tRNA(Pro) deacylase
MVAPIVRDFLEEHHAPFRETAHPRVNTALAEAHKDHMQPAELAKTVVVRAGGSYVLAAMAADTRIDWPSLARVLQSADLSLASEQELDSLFPELETGAIPPLGPLFGLPVYVDSGLVKRERIAFNGGSHTNTIHMPVAPFLRLVKPHVCSFAVPIH